MRAHTTAKVLVQIVSWVGTIYVLRTLDAHALGLYALASIAFSYASLVHEGGLLEALVQHHPDSPYEKRSVFTVLLGIGFLTAACLAGISLPMAALLEAPEVAPLMAAYALALVITSIGVMPYASLIREMRFGRLAVISAAQASVASATTVTLAWSGAGAWSLVLGSIAGVAIRTLLLNFAVPSLFWPTRRIRSAFAYLRTSAVLIADGVLWRWYTSIDVLLLGRWVGTAQLGQYSFAQQVANMPLEKISTVVNDVSLPAYSSLSADRSEAARLMLETIRTHAALGFPLFWGLASVAATAVPLIFGAQWTAAVFPLIVLAIIAPLRLMGSVETPAMTGTGNAAVLLRTKFLIVPIMTLALVIGCRFDGVRGAALVWLCVFPVCYTVAFRYVLQAIGLTYGPVGKAVRGPAIAAAVMALVVLLVQEAVGDLPGLPSVARLLILIATGAITYPLLLRWTDPQSFALLSSRAQSLLRPGQ